MDCSFYFSIKIVTNHYTLQARYYESIKLLLSLSSNNQETQYQKIYHQDKISQSGLNCLSLADIYRSLISHENFGRIQRQDPIVNNGKIVEYIELQNMGDTIPRNFGSIVVRQMRQNAKIQIKDDLRGTQIITLEKNGGNFYQKQQEILELKRDVLAKDNTISNLLRQIKLLKDKNQQLSQQNTALKAAQNEPKGLFGTGGIATNNIFRTGGITTNSIFGTGGIGIGGSLFSGITTNSIFGTGGSLFGTSGKEIGDNRQEDIQEDGNEGLIEPQRYERISRKSQLSDYEYQKSDQTLFKGKAIKFKKIGFDLMHNMDISVERFKDAQYNTIYIFNPIKTLYFMGTLIPKLTQAIRFGQNNASISLNNVCTATGTGQYQTHSFRLQFCDQQTNQDFMGAINFGSNIDSI